jgi:regulator of replication initiation timing
MDSQVAELQLQVDELKSANKELVDENKVLKDQLVKLGAVGDAEKERLLKKVIENHPDCYDQIEFGEAFDEACNK